MGQEDLPNGKFECHPECLKRSYWRRVLLEIEEEIRGMRPGQFADLVIAVEKAEVQALADLGNLTKFDDPDIPVKSWWDRPNTEVGRNAAIELWMRDFTPDQIDIAFGFPHGATEQLVEKARIHRKAREVVAAHLNGHSPSRISRDLRIGIPTVCELLRRIGEEPHTVRNLAKSADVNRAIQRRYEEGWGYRQIAEHLGITESKVRQRLQYLRRKGRIDAPVRASSNVRRRPRAAE